MRNRYEELDSLRGIAALSVFFGHMYLVFNGTYISKLLFDFGPFRAMIAGSEAVTLFFVLSGFVLSLPFYDKSMKFNYGTYVVKRICRIYIPFVIAFLFAYFFRELFYNGPIKGLSSWFNKSWSEPLNEKSIMEHLILVDTFTSNLNNVFWSLVHEMRVSFIFPLLMWIIIRVNYKTGLILGFVLSSLSIIYSYITNAPFWGTEFYATLHYCSMFIIGALIAKYRIYLVQKISSFSVRRKVVLFFSGLVLYLYAHPSFLLNIIITNFNPFYRTVIDTWFISIGACILILFAISSTYFSKILRNKFVMYIGQVSYSLYLMHLIVLLSLVHALHEIIPMWGTLMLATLLVFIFSSFTYYFVEKPAIKLGKFLTKSKQNKEDKQPKVSVPL